MAQGAHYLSDKGTPTNDLRDKTIEGFDKVADQVEGAVKNIAARGREAGQDMQVVAGNIKSAVDTSVKEQPMATLAVTAALGFVLGALWKS